MIKKCKTYILKLICFMFGHKCEIIMHQKYLITYCKRCGNVIITEKIH